MPLGCEDLVIILAGVNIVLQFLPQEKAITRGSLISFVMLSSAFRMYVYFCTPI